MLEVTLMRKFYLDPFAFIEHVWGLVPQVQGEPFIKGRHLTWQQCRIIEAVRLANLGGKRKITIRSWHGVGKTTALAMLILWFLFTHLDSKVPCTAPTSSQLNDALWSECNKLITKMPDGIKQTFDWNTEYIRITDAPASWFARARTASKDKPEALAGIHAEDMMLVVDEASGVDNAVFEASKSALTWPRTIEIMISNPTRLEGYFYDSHHKMADSYYVIHLNGEESPIVDQAFVDEIILKYWRESDQYKIRVQGIFPNQDDMDAAGYLPLVGENDLTMQSDVRLWGRKYLGVDPAGEGKDLTAWVLRDSLSARIIAREATSTPNSIALRTLTIMTEHNVDPADVTIDNFGAGANVAQELGLLGYRVNAINVGEGSGDTSAFLNLRAEWSWRMREWIKRGGVLSAQKEWEEILRIKYIRSVGGQLQIMSKKEMRKRGIKSPNFADALMLTFRQETFVQAENRQNMNGWRVAHREVDWADE